MSYLISEWDKVNNCRIYECKVCKIMTPKTRYIIDLRICEGCLEPWKKRGEPLFNKIHKEIKQTENEDND